MAPVRFYRLEDTPDLKGAIGTLSHNRSFTSRELAEYRGYSAKYSTRLVRRLHAEGYIHPTKRGGWYPTTKGWDWIEGREYSSENPMSTGSTVGLVLLGFAAVGGLAYVLTRPSAAAAATAANNAAQPVNTTPSVLQQIAAATPLTQPQTDAINAASTFAQSCNADGTTCTATPLTSAQIATLRTISTAQSGLLLSPTQQAAIVTVYVYSVIHPPTS